jgi:predicted metalloprotease
MLMAALVMLPISCQTRTGANPPASQPQEALTSFNLATKVRAYAGSLEDLWHSQMKNFTPARVVVFRGATPSACDIADIIAYCPNDLSIYISQNEILAIHAGTTQDETVLAIALAHEYGHHIQNGMNWLTAPGRTPMSKSAEAAASRELEAGADKAAGWWYGKALQQNLVREPGDDEGLARLLTFLGDDTQERLQYVVVKPSERQHGTAEERANNFRAGLNCAAQGESCRSLRLMRP